MKIIVADFSERETKIAETLRGKSGDQVEVIPSPVDREKGYPEPIPAPPSLKEWKALRIKPIAELKRLGLRLGDETEDGRLLMLFPGEWYNAIPERLLVTNIFGITRPFRKKTHGSDIRFGCLAYGVAAKKQDR